tara:strand:- start:319 stop:1329 length:1011 start_codon:yes stop_codon:yes gene_type:complete
MPGSGRMRAMMLKGPGTALELACIDRPMPRPGQILVRVEACGVCRTDLHVLDGDLANPAFPLIPGHEIVGRVEELGGGETVLKVGDRVGIPWLGWTCGVCEHCAAGRENLCERAKFNGYTLNGGYADYAIADRRYCFPLADTWDAAEAAPLLCAGLIGYRSLRFADEAGEARRLGIYGFGAAAHIVTQIARFQGREVFAFVRPGDRAAADFARSLGAAWAGEAGDKSPQPLDAAIIYAPVGALIPVALQAIRPGGTVVCAGIHMTDIPAFSYDLLWRERRIVSVANLERRDGDEFLALASRIPVRTEVHRYRLEAANRALEDLRNGAFQGAAVLVP